jgi:hypothetical protein
MASPAHLEQIWRQRSALAASVGDPDATVEISCRNRGGLPTAAIGGTEADLVARCEAQRVEIDPDGHHPAVRVNV